ncbi:MAG: hypothetical protein ACYDB2_10345 [Acidimicrobiales bacterium]
MHIVGRLTNVLALTVSAVLLGVVGGVPIASAAGDSDVVASFSGGTIDLSQGWGSAAVCVVTSSQTSCFSSESDYHTWASSQPTLLSGVVATPSSNCSTGLKLFSQVGYAGRELILYVQASWINLSAYSFANVLSSYQVGACAVGMTASVNGTGAVYPGATSAGSKVSTLGATWNNRMQSVYIS